MNGQDLASLPGPRRFWNRIHEDLSFGASLIIVSPHSRASSALADMVSLERQRRRWDPIVLDLEHLSGRVPDAIVAAVTDSGAAGVNARDIVDAPELAGHTLFVDTTRASDTRVQEWMGFTEAFSRASKAADPLSRPCICTLAEGSLAHPSPREDLLRVHWWWGVIGRADVATHLAEVADFDDRIAGECIIEIARFDLDLAEVLAGERGLWYGDAQRLTCLLRDFATEADLPMINAELEGDPVAGLPPPHCREAWAAGSLERWDGVSATHRAAESLSGADVTRWLWYGQIATLLPALEARRFRLAAWVAEHETVVEEQQMRGALKPESQATPLEELDFAPLATIVGELVHHLRLSRELVEYAHDLRGARNRLAHLTPVTSDNLRRLTERFASERGLLATGSSCGQRRR